MAVPCIERRQLPFCYTVQGTKQDTLLEHQYGVILHSACRHPHTYTHTTTYTSCTLFPTFSPLLPTHPASHSPTNSHIHTDAHKRIHSEPTLKVLRVIGWLNTVCSILVNRGRAARMGSSIMINHHISTWEATTSSCSSHTS